MNFIFISIFYILITLSGFGASSSSTPFEGWTSSASGTPLKRTFFHRKDVPVFIKVDSYGSPIDLNLSINMYPKTPLPVCGKEATAVEKAMHREALRAIYQSDANSPGIGLMWLQFRAPTNIHLISFSVQESYRGQGYGAQALITVLSMLKSRPGIHTVSLSIETSRDNASRLAGFYRRLGFKHGAPCPTFPGQANMHLNLCEFNPKKSGLVKNRPKSG